MSKIVKTPDPPYYSVIFTSVRSEGDNGYEKVGNRIVEIADNQEGFLGAESLRDENGFGMTISYWDSIDSIDNWKHNLSHIEAKQKGKDMWYSEYMIRICKVEVDNYFDYMK